MASNMQEIVVKKKKKKTMGNRGWGRGGEDFEEGHLNDADSMYVDSEVTWL